jgi:uncharacterized protein with HEPN domain
LEACERVKSYSSGGRDQFLADPKTQDAVLRNFMIIGEATKRVPPELRQAQPQVPWKGMAAFRDVLVHDYAGVDLQEVWRLVDGEVPRLIQSIRALLPPLAELEREISGEGEKEP